MPNWSDKTAGLVMGALMLSLALTAWTGRLALETRQSIAEHSLLIQQLSDGVRLVLAEAQFLGDRSQSLARIQQVNDRNIANFQLLTNGSMKRDLPKFESLTGHSLTTALQHFEAFQTSVSSIIQSRSTLERMLQGREQVIDTAERLVLQADNLVEALDQDDADMAHLRAAYRVKSLLVNHGYRVRQAYLDQAPAPDMGFAELNTLLALLSTDKRAPASPAIRRSAANLLKNAQDHLAQLAMVAEHHQVASTINATQTELGTLGQSLGLELEASVGLLYSTTIFSQIFALLAGVSSLGLAGGLGFVLASRNAKLHATSEPELLVEVASERTSPNFINQLKTEKNLLMNDIKPIGEGILYIKADEHLESTGDLARCLNQSRESLIRRIEALKRQVGELKSALADTVQSPLSDKPQDTVRAVHPDSALIDLTFKGHAELDGLQRHLRAQNQLDKETCKQLLVRCLRAERVLDEIRVRVNKSAVSPDPAENESAATQTTSVQMEALGKLVGQLLENLDEFQTQPAKSRRIRSA